MHGYEMMKALEERSGGFYVASAGTHLPHTANARRPGLITYDQAEGKKVYSITNARRALLAERQGGGGDKFRSWHDFGPAKHWHDPEMQALRSEAMEVTRLFVIAGRTSVHNQRKQPHCATIIERTCKELSDMIYSSRQSQIRIFPHQQQKP